MMGYGGTDSPESISAYTFKRAADDMAELARQLSVPRIMLGGHDWGGMVVFRIALWYPTLVTSIFSICTPYTPPTATYYPLEEITKTVLPNFKYQLHLAGPEVQKSITTKDQIRNFLKGMYGGRTSTGEVLFDVSKGVILENLDDIGPSKLLNEEEVEYYAQEYSRNGLRGPLNWYRTRELNYKDELALVEKGEASCRLKCPTMFVQATQDAALPPSMSQNMERWFDSGLKRAEVVAAHWCLWQAKEECNKLIAEWVVEQLRTRDGQKSSL